MVHSLVLPPFLYAFFGMFVGTVQAFVFTMLTITYIAVATK
jgi:F-type H+-transporting ATPase subunit a